MSLLLPSYENGLDSMVGGFSIFGSFVIVFLYLLRKDNRLRIYRELGFIDRSVDLLKERLERKPFKAAILWTNVAHISHAHIVAVFAIYLLVFVAKWPTMFWWLFIYYGGLYGVAGGAHMLYSHRSYKAGPLYHVVMVILHSMAMSNSIIHWSRDHRSHHKFTDTDADHTNRKRGLFFSHFGWLLLEKHPEVIKVGRKTDMTDLSSNPYLAFQRKYLAFLYVIFGNVIPVAVPCLLWNERFWTAVHTCITLAWCCNVNSIAFVNSWFHSQGVQPYTTRSTATDGTFLRHLFTLGAGDHNFHHAFPYDYSESEHNSVFLFTKNIIDLCHRLGLVWDLKKMKPESVKGRKMKIRQMSQVINEVSG